MKKKKLNVGILGLGVGEQHLIGFKKSKHINQISVFDVDEKKIKKIINSHKKINIYQSENELLDDPEIDIVSIASFDQYHFKQIKRALKNKKHIFCEKPICTKYSDLQEIKMLLKKSKTVMTTNTILRTSPRFLDLKKKISQNYFGEIYLIELDYNYGRLHKLINGWRGKIKDFSVMLSGGIHMIDLLLWFVEKMPTKIFGFSNNMNTVKTKIKCDDNSIAILKFNNKLIAKISSNFGCVYPHFHKVNIYGTKASFEQTHSGQFFLKKKKKFLYRRICFHKLSRCRKEWIN